MAGLASYRTHIDDFLVDEELLYPPSGQGAYSYLRIEKRDRTTAAVAAQLAAQLGVPLKSVCFAGRKDRHAVTRQWFSVPRAADQSLAGLQLEGTTVLEVARHDQRLRLGELAANRFVLIVRKIESGSRTALEERLASLERWGFSNRFGRQRFGGDADNARRGAQILRGERRARSRRTARLLVAAPQAEIFNEIIERRGELWVAGDRPQAPQPGRRPIDRLMEGDLVQVEATGLLQRSDDVAADQARADRGELSATAPLVGPSCRWAQGRVGELEHQVLENSGIVVEGMRRLRLRGERRAIRVWLSDTQARWLDGNSLELTCRLSSGSYASVFLEELFAGIDDLEERRGGGIDDQDAAG